MTDEFKKPKDPRETLVLTFNATDELTSDEVLTDVKASEITVAFGKDPNVGTMLVDAIVTAVDIFIKGKTITAGHAAQAVVTGGVSGNIYLVAITCHTSNANKTLTFKGLLAVNSN